jgi:hypothetical protein
MLTFEEIEKMKAQAMLVIEHKLVSLFENGPMNCGDTYVVTYTLSCGSSAELAKLKEGECGAVPPVDGPPCRLQKGHDCEHSSVVRWK